MHERIQLPLRGREVLPEALPSPVMAGPGVLVHLRRDREVAAASWLILAAPNAEKARHEWEDYGVALLRCGSLLSAVRIPADLVYAAAGTEELEQVRAFLADVLDGGPIFHDTGGRQFYALTPASAPSTWHLTVAECLGSNTFLGVPATDRTEPDCRYPAYWVLPMDGPGTLCAPDDVAGLVLAGHQAATKNAEADR
ncbi:hypothetical protein ABZ990_14690 [Streptomyces sp. NPDC046203]|uniref:hypothetical protein n=1 Tax=Streptomyces sp. NPDC046203 TaxID=3154602 RepID=UPI0033EA96B4